MASFQGSRLEGVHCSSLDKTLMCPLSGGSVTQNKTSWQVQQSLVQMFPLSQLTYRLGGVRGVNVIVITATGGESLPLPPHWLIPVHVLGMLQNLGMGKHRTIMCGVCPAHASESGGGETQNMCGACPAHASRIILIWRTLHKSGHPWVQVS